MRDVATERVLSVSTVTPIYVRKLPQSTIARREVAIAASRRRSATPRPAPNRPARRNRHDVQMRAAAAAADPERGFVIVAVLWILAALASLAMIFAVYLSNSAQAPRGRRQGVANRSRWSPPVPNSRPISCCWQATRRARRKAHFTSGWMAPPFWSSSRRRPRAST